jgi:hypothetical protein
MPEREEIRRSLLGVYRLARLDSSGLGELDVTVDGFWRSFFAIVLVAPAYALLVMLHFQAEPGGDLGWVLLIESMTYVLSWAIFPLLALAATSILKLGQHYTTLIVAANWAAVLQVLLFLVAVIVAAQLPTGLGGLIMLVTTIWIIFYQWFLTRAALQTSGGLALALVLLDQLLNTMLNVYSDGLT